MEFLVARALKPIFLNGLNSIVLHYNREPIAIAA